MTQYIFTYGNILDTTAIFVSFLQAPEIRELALIGGRTQHSQKHWDTIETIIANIKDYLNNILGTKGSRTTVAQRAYRTVLAACSSSKLAEEKNVRRAAAVLDIATRNVSRGIKDRLALEEMPNSGYVACSREAYRNKMPDKARTAIKPYIYINYVYTYILYIPNIHIHHII